MFDLSFGKLAIIFALCLIVLGPEKLPKLAAQLGRFAGQARAMARHFRTQLEQEIAADQLKKEFHAADEAINKIVTQTSSPISTVAAAVDEALFNGESLRDTSPEAMHANDPPAPAEADQVAAHIVGTDSDFNLAVANNPVHAADAQKNIEAAHIEAQTAAEQPATASVENKTTHTAA